MQLRMLLSYKTSDVVRFIYFLPPPLNSEATVRTSRHMRLCEIKFRVKYFAVLCSVR